nr:hypothetical protein CFP56_41252 [Quercus suber]
MHAASVSNSCPWVLVMAEQCDVRPRRNTILDGSTRLMVVDTASCRVHVHRQVLVAVIGSTAKGKDQKAVRVRSCDSDTDYQYKPGFKSNSNTGTVGVCLRLQFRKKGVAPLNFFSPATAGASFALCEVVAHHFAIETSVFRVSSHAREFLLARTEAIVRTEAVARTTVPPRNIYAPSRSPRLLPCLLTGHSLHLDPDGFPDTGLMPPARPSVLNQLPPPARSAGRIAASRPNNPTTRRSYTVQQTHDKVRIPPRECERAPALADLSQTLTRRRSHVSPCEL